jgi:4-amino-4-deoxy-L-arabinose transferase-like glycosyltransferase
MLFSNFLTFSDAAKFADIARNLVQKGVYAASFSFGGGKPALLAGKTFFNSGILPFMPFSIAALFKIFGVNDFAVIATSFFFFLLTLVFAFLLTKKIFKSNLSAVLSTLTIGFSYDLINYATSGASESPFIFEIVAASYFISLRKGWATVVAFLLLILMYFTRPQAFIYIVGLILYWLLVNFKTRIALIYFGLAVILGFLTDRFILQPLSGKFFLYSILEGGQGSLTRYLPGVAVSDVLRGQVDNASVVDLIKKVFYNLYNFYKLTPQIINPYLFILFVIGLFRWDKENSLSGQGRIQNSFKVAVIFMAIATFVVVAASIPFFRYIHPIVPLIYIIAVATLVWIVRQINKSKKFIVLASAFLILVFGAGQTLGVIFLDSRFEANTHNLGKPPVYVVLSQILKENTNPNYVVITNLDTWGSWYGECKTIWFPLEPKQIIDPSTGKIPFDAIYLTSYLIDDQNYYMGGDWREIFNNPTDPKKWVCDGCSEIAKEFKLKGAFKVFASEDYEKQDANAVLLVKNH